MKVLGGLGRLTERAKKNISGSLVIVLVTVLAVLAGLYRGVPIVEIELNDGGVWVTNGNMHLVAHLNYPSKTLDGGLAVTAESFEVEQHGSKVVLRDLSASTVSAVDTAAFVLGATGTYPTDLQISYGGDSVAVTERESGKIWGFDFSEVASFSRDAAPLFEEPGAQAVVSAAGNLLVVSSNGKVQKLPRNGNSFGAISEAGSLRDFDASVGGIQFTTVGDQVVAYDSSSNVLHTSSEVIPLPQGNDLRLQAPGPENDFVILASPTGLIYVSLNDKDVTEVPAGPGARPGVAVEPVFFAGCTYAAWTKTGAYLRDCPNDSDDVSLTVDKIAQAREMSFRTNRDVIVLNDVNTGLVLLIDDEMIEVDNWLQVQANIDLQKEDSEEQDESDPSTVMNPEVNTDPVANPDVFGVRPGRTVWLPVLANDEDADGDILTAHVVDQPEMGPVQQVSMGEALQIVVPDNATGTDTFNYRAEDGRGGSSEAQVTLNVHDWNINEAPKPLRRPTLTVSQGGQISYNVLNDWYDPDGDMVHLFSAGPAEGVAVESRPDGTVTIRDLGTLEPGIRPVPVTVTDGKEQATYEIQLDVRPGNQNYPPIANADHVTAVVGQTVNVQPLLNDSDPNGDRIRLVSVEAPALVTATVDYASGIVRLSSDAPGSHYVIYKVSDSRAEARGLIRFDVIDPGTDGQPPAAMPDMALLPHGGSALVDLTANDTDPMGGVLVVQSLQVPEGSGLSVQLIDHHMVRVSAPAELTGETRFSYTVSNGYGTATAEVLVIPLPPESTDQPPTAVDDVGLVRAGDVVTIDVLANDISPAHLPLEIDPTLTVTGNDAGGVAFVSGNKVRYRAGSEPGTARITYTIRDSVGGFSSATVVVTVTARDDRNNAPNPPTLQGRTFAGKPVRIVVPTSGVDPDGDSVSIGGIEGPAPLKGSVTIGDGYFEYTPGEGMHGTDVFGYSVIDPFGAVGKGLVQVGISPRPGTNQAPYATPDVVSARPDRLLAIPVTVNDIDPDGDQIQLVADSVHPVDDATKVAASVKNNRVELVTPSQPGILRYSYDITDGRGGTGRGLLTVEVSHEAPLLYPIARDDIVQLAEIIDQDSVTVDVLANDEDPDGSSDELRLASNDPGVRVTGDRKLEIQVTDHRQMVVYSVTDPDNQEARAVVTVPGRLEQRPVLRTDNVPVKVMAEELLELNLSDYVLVRTGHTPKITFAETVKVGPGSDGLDPVKDATTLQYRSVWDFLGATSIQFEVTDGSGPDDPNGLKAMLSIPIIVEANPDGNKPPVLTPTEVIVELGEGPAKVDLGTMISDPNDPNNERITVKMGQASEPFEAKLSGLSLEVSAPINTSPGTSGSLPVVVTDDKGAEASGTIPLKVVSSRRPLLSISQISINDANAGQPKTINLDDYVTNPFASEGRPYTIVGQPEVVLGKGTATASDRSITVTPAEGFKGQMNVSFRLADATEDPARQVTGQISATVRDRPDAPTNVVASNPVSRAVDVAWSAGPANGAPITSFEVRYIGENGHSGRVTVGQVTSTTVTGLTNNVYYTFTVIATNEVGDSDPSAPSNKERPDTKPDRVGTPTAEFGDKEITVSWPAGTTEGAPIDHYEVTISPAPGGVVTQDVKGTSMTWTGLTNGTAYSFTVVAVSVNDMSSEPSAASAPEVPAGAPAQPNAPQVVKNPASKLDPSAKISWTAPDGNGDSNLTYEVRQSNGTVVCTGTETNCNVTMPVTAEDQTFQVRATNKSKLWSEWSPVSNAVRPWQPPNPVSDLSVTATGANNTVKLSFKPGALNGAKPSEVTYRWRANGVEGTVPSGGGTVTHGGAFPNGQNVSVSVYPVASVNGETAQGDSAPARSVTAYGPAVTPTPTCSVSGMNIVCSWSGGRDGGKPSRLRMTGDASNVLDGSKLANGSHTFYGLNWNHSRSICLEAFRDDGSTFGKKCSSATVSPPPESGHVVSASGTQITFYVQGIDPNRVEKYHCWQQKSTNHTYGWDVARRQDGSTGRAARVGHVVSGQMTWGGSNVTLECGIPMSTNGSVDLYGPGFWID